MAREQKELQAAIDFSQGELREIKEAHETLMRHHKVVVELCDSNEDQLAALRAENERLRQERDNWKRISEADDESAKFMHQRLTTLRARVAELEKDKERLDVAEKYLISLSRLTTPYMSGIRYSGQYHNPAEERGEAGPSYLRWQGRTLRETLDAARQSTEGRDTP